jgi:hypothetical protein
MSQSKAPRHTVLQVNYPAVAKHASQAAEIVTKEANAGMLSEPLGGIPLFPVRLNPFNAIEREGKDPRFCCDMSSPQAEADGGGRDSLNAGIPWEDTELARPRGLCPDSLSISRRPPVYVYKRAVAGSAAAPSRAAAADGALTGRQCGVSRALCGPQWPAAPARATACCAAAPPRDCCSQRRSDGPLLAEPRRPEGAARAGRPCGRHHAGTSGASTGRVLAAAVEQACDATSHARSAEGAARRDPTAAAG